MTKEPTRMSGSTDRLSYLWLAMAVLLLPLVYSFVWIVPLAAWLAPVFMVRFVRTQKSPWGIYVGSIVYMAIFIAVLIPVFATVMSPMMYAFALLIVGGAGLSAFLPYVADRLLAPRLSGFASTLVFPSAWVIVEYVRPIVIYAGTCSVVAYTQYHNLPLMQIVSVTGLWGVSFLVAWLAAVVNYVWERGFARRRVRLVAGTYAAILILVLLFGGARLAFFPVTSKTVRVAAVLKTSGGRSLEGNETALQDATREAVRAGAKVVVFHEAAFLMIADGEANFVTRAQELAREEGAYLLLGLDVLSDVPGRPHQNKAILVTPSGEVEWEYRKRYLAFSEMPGYAQGEGSLPISGSPYGTISSVICLDALFPEYVHRPGIDIMLIPSWQDLAYEQAVSLISRMFVFRAVENGYALVSPVYRGWTVIADPQGRILAESNYHTTDEQIVYADVPTEGVWTLYSVLGDWFAWLSIAGFVGLVAWAVVRCRRSTTGV